MTQDDAASAAAPSLAGRLFRRSKRRRPDPLDCPKGRHTYLIPSTYPPGMTMPGEPGIIVVHDCHCPAASPGHIHSAKVG